MSQHIDYCLLSGFAGGNKENGNELNGYYNCSNLASFESNNNTDVAAVITPEKIIPKYKKEPSAYYDDKSYSAIPGFNDSQIGNSKWSLFAAEEPVVESTPAPSPIIDVPIVASTVEKIPQLPTDVPLTVVPLPTESAPVIVTGEYKANLTP